MHNFKSYKKKSTNTVNSSDNFVHRRVADAVNKVLARSQTARKETTAYGQFTPINATADMKMGN